MGSFSNYWEIAILDHLFGKGVYTPPTIWVGLSTADPEESGGGLAEPSGNSYARVETAASDWDAAAAGATANAAAIEFAESSGAWGEITHFGLFNALTAGQLLAHGSVTVPKTIGDGDTASFAIGDLDVTLD